MKLRIKTYGTPDEIEALLEKINHNPRAENATELHAKLLKKYHVLRDAANEWRRTIQFGNQPLEYEKCKNALIALLEEDEK